MLTKLDPTFRRYRLEITDRDGDIQTYNLYGPNLFSILNSVYHAMDTGGDFYGHTIADTIKVEINELVS